MSKPEYKIPDTKEIMQTPSNGLKVASTFSGGGGSCLGYRWSGYDVVWASEFVAAAADTYQANFNDTTMDRRDIRDVSSDDVLKAAGVKEGELDILDGSPPCTSFSMSGKRAKHWGKVVAHSDRAQRCDDLFLEYIRLVDGIKPRAFVAENVAGLRKGVARGWFNDILNAMKAIGYTVGVRELDAQWLGVPQRRRRLIFIGIREDLGVGPPFPKPMTYRYSLRDALPDVQQVHYETAGHDPHITTKPGQVLNTITVGRPTSWKVTHVSGYAKGTRYSSEAPSPTVMAGGMGGSGRNQVLLQDNTYQYQRDGYEKLRRGENDRDLCHTDPHQPCDTVVAVGGVGKGVMHPSEPRKFTIPELKRICGFPDDFVLTGSYAQQWERLGNAVPPPMMKAISESLLRVLLPKEG